MRLYADEAAYLAYTGETTAPANLDRLLAQASRTVDRILTGRVYATDAAGMPTDTEVATALSDAVCAIASSTSFVTALSTGGSAVWDSVKIGSVSLSGRKAEATSDVDGLPVPLGVLSLLAAVGPVRVTTGAPGYVRPLDRIVN